MRYADKNHMLLKPGSTHRGVVEERRKTQSIYENTEMPIKSDNDHKEILLQFKLNLKDILAPEYSDERLLKWLRARNFNLKKAEKIFRDNYYNRITCEVDDILNYYEKPQVLQVCEVSCFLGYTRDGTVLRYVAAGRFDGYGLIMSLSCFQICHYCVQMAESDLKALEKESLKTGVKTDQITYIIDMEGFSIQQVLHQNVIEMGLDSVRLFQDCYPEIWRNVLVINAPTIFEKVFNLFKPVVSHNLAEKIKVVGKDSTKRLLLEYIDEDVLPAFLGGKRVDSKGDPYCKEFIPFGGKISENLYGNKCRTLLSLEDAGVKFAEVGPRSFINFTIVVKETNSRLHIECRTENGSIWFTMFYKEFETNSNRESLDLPESHDHINVDDEYCKYKQVTVSIRGQSHCCQEDMTLLCKWPGIYVIQLNNSGNWFTSRKVFFRHTLLPPKRVQ